MITITNEQLIDNAARAYDEKRLAAQRGQSCRYFGPNNTVCAIGASLPPDLVLSHAVNCMPVHCVPWHQYGIQFEDIEFARKLQRAHDDDNAFSQLRCMIGRAP